MVADRISVRGKIVAAIGVISAVLLLLFGAVLGVGGFARAEEPTAGAYTEIAAAYDGPAVYPKTTGADIKSGITVTGTKADGNTETVDASAYTVKNGTSELADDYKFVDEAGGTLTLTVELISDTTKTATVSVEVKAAVSYTQLRVAAKSDVSFTTDLTADKLNSATYFTVEGFKDGSTWTDITDHSLLSVGISDGRLKPNQGNTVTFTYLPTGITASANVNCGAAANIVSATADVIYTDMKDGYYVTPDGDSAFTTGMSVDKFMAGIAITVKYANNEYVLDLRHNSGTNTFTAATGETVIVSGYDSNMTDLSGVTIYVATADDPANPVSAAVPPIELEERRIVGLVVDGSKINTADLKSSTSTSVSSFRNRFSGAVKIKYNNGDLSPNTLQTTALRVSGNLAPSGEDLIKGLSQTDYKYTKSVTLTYNYTENGQSSSVSAEVPLLVTFETPNAISSIDGTIEPQKSFTTSSGFNYTGLTANFEYGSSSVDVPLTELSSYCSVVFKENGEEVDKLSVKVTTITVSVRINDKYQISQEFDCDISGGVNYTVTGIGVSPNFSAANLVYNPHDCSRPLSFNSSETVTGYDVPVLTLEGTGSGKHADGKVSFTSSGKYKVTIKLTKNGDFVFDNLESSTGVVYVNEYEVYYEITVDKASIILTLSGSDTRKYGEQHAPAFTPSAMTTNGSTVELLGESSTEESKKELPVYEYRYYEQGGNPSSAKAEMPKDVGRYNVFIHTEPTGWYEGADSQAASFVIEKKPISTASVASPTFDKDAEAYDASAFIDTTQLVYGAKPQDVFGTPVIKSYTGIDAAVPEAEKRTLFHAGKYTVDIPLSAAAFKNYCWSGATGSTKEVTFTIKQREINVSVTVAQDLVYGKESNNPNPSIKVTDTKNEGYINFGSAYYYAGYTSGVPSEPPMASSPNWARENAGTYAVYYKDAAANKSAKVYSSDITVTTGDYYASFPIAKAEIAKFTVPANPEFEFGDADKSVSLGGYDKKYKDIFTVTVSGTLMSDTTAAVGMSFDYENGKIIVRDAGWYSVEIAFKAGNTNYQWSDGTITELTFTKCISVAKKKISPTFDKTDPIQFGFTGEGQAPVPKLVVDGHTFTFTTTYLLGGGASGNPELKDGKPYKAGSYLIRLSALDCADTVSGGTYSVVKNYEFDFPDETYFDKAFTILSAQLPKLTLDADKTSQVYKGDVFTLTELITTWLAGDGTNTYSIDQLKTVSVTSSKVTGSNVAMRDVATYKISVKPNTNYEWASGAAASKDATVELTFTITQADIIIEWNDSYEHIYDNTPFKVEPTLTVIDKSGDIVTANVKYKKRNADATDLFATATDVSEAKDAGWYFAYVDSLDGAAKDNYKIPASGFYKDFVIKKQVVKAITHEKSTTKPTFGDGGTVTFSSKTANWQGIVRVKNIERFLLDEWVTTPPQPAVVDNSCYDGATGVFTYVDAGRYNITFKLGEYSNNYCFTSDEETDFTAVSGNGYTITCYAFVTVERKELTAPTLGDKRAMQYSAVSNFDFGSVDGLASDKYQIKYGKGNVSSEGGAYTDESNSVPYTIKEDGSVELSERGKYFVLFRITEKPYNYVWKIDTTDNKGSGYVGGLGNVYYAADKSEVYLHYAIINKSIDITFSAVGYTFGDNGYNGTVTLDGAVPMGGSETEIIDTEKLKDGFEIIYRFSKKGTGDSWSSVGTVTRTWFEGEWKYVASEGLVNNLVWDSGDYRVAVSVNFGTATGATGEEPDYEDLTFTDTDLVFTVKPREIKVEWSAAAGDSAVSYDDANKMFVSVYDGAEHNLVATVSNMPKKTADDTSTVTVTTSKLDAKNAATYTFEVTGVDSDNFAIPANKLPATLEISPRTVKVSAVEVTNHIYGEDVLPEEKKWAYTDGNATPETEKFIETDGDVVTVTVSGIYKTTSVKTYPNAITVTTTNSNYYLVPTNANFTVVPRKITVTLKSDGYVVYGNAPTLYKDTYTATLTDGQKKGDGAALTGDAIVNNDASDSIFTLGLEGVTDVTSTSIAADTYTLTAVKGSNGNYDVTFVKDGETYIIAKAEITAPVINVYGGANGAEYDAAYHGILLDTSTATVVNGTTENPLTWYVRDEDANRWVKYDPDEKHRVKDVGDYVYKFKITAPNHFDLVIGGGDNPTEFTVKVKKAEVTVAVNIAITYSEDNPADRDYKMTLDDLKAENGIYTFGTFKGSDNISNIDELALVAGQKLYTIPTYTAVTSSVQDGGYAIVFNENALTSKNYTFKGADGTLTVNKFAFTVKINNLSTTYYTAYSALGANIDDSSLPVSIYGGKLGTNVSALHNLYELACADLVTTADNKYKTGVGKYDIVGTQKDTSKTNYTITFVNADDSGKEHGVYTITPATMTLTATGYNEVYDENSHALIDTSVTTVDGSVASLVYHVSEMQLNAAALAALEDGAWTGNVPKTIDVWAEKYIYVRATESNHATAYAEVTSSVTKATVNTIVDFDFANGTVKTSPLGASDSAAWTYGKLDTDSSSAYHNPDGYDGDGQQKATEPRAAFSRKGGVNGAQYPTVTVYKDSEKLGDCTLTGDKTATTVNDLIKRIFAAGKFGAGDYRVTVYMEDTENYPEIDKTYYFRVAKKQLTVEANNVKVVYGEDIEASAYTDAKKTSLKYEVRGLVNNGEEDEELADAINGDVMPIFTTKYAKGWQNGSVVVGGYDISITNETAVKMSDNYEITVRGNVVTVTQRTVTIKIDDKQNTYNLRVNETAQTLSFDVVWGADSYDFYDDKNTVIELHTDALTHRADKPNAKTNDVRIRKKDGKVIPYPIYATFKTYGDDNTSFGNNYIIKFSTDCSYSESEYGAIDVENAIRAESGNFAGSFTITQAKLSVGITTQPGGVYDGTPKPLVVNATGDEGVIDFTIKYYSNNTLLNGAPTDVGDKYSVTYSLDDTNYISGGDTTFDFKITKGTLTVTVNNAQVQYGTQLDPNGKRIDKDGNVLEDIGTIGNGDLFTGVKASYAFSQDGEFKVGEGGVTADNIAQKIIDRETRKGALDLSKLYFKYGDYTVKSSPRENAYKMTVNFDGADAIPSKNYNIVMTADSQYCNLTVIARNVTITVHGYNSAKDGTFDYAAEGLYTGQGHSQDITNSLTDERKTLNSYFKAPDGWSGQSNDSLTDLNLRLSLEYQERYVVGYYSLIADYNNGNYDISFKYNDNGQGSYYRVKPAPLTAYAQGLYDGAYENVFEVIYGDEIRFREAFIGLVNGETYSSLVKSGEAGGAYKFTTEYEEWVSDIGDYSVATSAGDVAPWFTNYEITGWKNVSFKVVQRAITANTPSNRVYDEERNGDGTLKSYNNGTYGATLRAVMTFGNIPNDKAVTYAPRYTDTYSGKDTTPNRVGTYTLKVDLPSNGNYIFADGGYTWTYSNYEITQKPLNVVWSPSSINVQDLNAASVAQKTAVIDGFIQELMTFGNSGFMLNTGSAASNVNTSAYETSNSGLKLVVYSNGTYAAHIKLTDVASANYKFQTPNAPDGTMLISLLVTSQSVDLSVSIVGWTFGDAENDPTGYVGGVADDSIEFTYASSAADYDTLDDSVKSSFTDGSLLGLLGVSANEFASKNVWQANAGTHIVRGYYRLTGQSAYFVFVIKQKEINAPTFTVNADNGTYTGGQLELPISLDRNAVLVTANGCTIQNVAGGGIALYATNARTYDIEFRLTSSNYKWSASAGADGGVVKKTWTVAQADGEILTLVQDDITYGDSVSPAATAKFGAPVTFVYKAVTQAEYDGKATKPADEISGWSSSAQVHNDYGYWVKAVSEETDNYAQAVKYGRFKIAKKTVHVTAYGTFVYGETFSATGAYNHYRFDSSDFVLGNNESRISVDTSALRYELDNNNAKLPYGTYGITLATDKDGYVIGMTAENYVVVPATVKGEFVVTKRPLSVTIGNAQVYYSLVPDLTGVTLTADALAFDDTVAMLGIRLTTAANDRSNVGSYIISAASSTTNNYDITYTSGICTVAALPVSVNLTAGGGEFGGTVTAPQIGSPSSTVSGVDMVRISGELSLTFRYVGTSFGNVAWDSDEMPEAAGRYTARLTGVGSNFVLTDTPSAVDFVIAKKTIYQSRISVKNAVYDETNHTPELVDALYGGFYTVGSGLYVNAGTHQVYLTLKNADNTEWNGISAATCSIPFVIEKANNEIIGGIIMSGWTYGDDAVVPQATTKYGTAAQYTWRYYDASGKLLGGVPATAGSYSVSLSVPEGDNYNALAETRVTFAIAKFTVTAPTLTVVEEGDDKNDVYTGGELYSAVVGFSNALMSMHYDGSSRVNGDSITLIAVNAGTYNVTFALLDGDNYAWDGFDGDVVRSWTIARKKIAKPSDEMVSFIISGKPITFIPDGFDGDTMIIDGNVYGYGGTFTATVTLRDPSNYEWEDGTQEPVERTWKIVGANVVFNVVVGVLSGLSAVAVGVAVWQVLAHRRKKRLVEQAMNAMDAEV